MDQGVTALVGDSAGGTVAALAALRTRGVRSLAPDLMMLLYANTDLTASGGSMETNAHGFGLDIADVEWFNTQWVPDRSRWSEPDISPLMVADLSGTCPAIVVTCELDPLRDQAETFARRLVEAGVPVTTRREIGMVHNFMLWDLRSPACASAGDRVADDLATATWRHPTASTKATR